MWSVPDTANSSLSNVVMIRAADAQLKTKKKQTLNEWSTRTEEPDAICGKDILGPGSPSWSRSFFRVKTSSYFKYAAPHGSFEKGKVRSEICHLDIELVSWPPHETCTFLNLSDQDFFVEHEYTRLRKVALTTRWQSFSPSACFYLRHQLSLLSESVEYDVSKASFFLFQ